MKPKATVEARYRRLLIAQHIVIWFLLGLNVASWVFFAAVVNSFAIPSTRGETVNVFAHNELLKEGNGHEC